MHVLTESMAIFLIVACTNSWSASVIYSYNEKGNTAGILGVTGITQESSWRCTSNSQILCSCPSVLLVGTIAQLDYPKGYSIAEGFVLETSLGAEYINLGEQWASDLGTADSSWVPRLLRRGEKVLVVAERCGAGGRNIVARDVFSNRMLAPSSGKASR